MRIRQKVVTMGRYDREDRTQKAMAAGILLCIVVAIVFPIAMYFAYVMPADTTYNRDFRSHVTMAKDQSTFDGMIQQIQVLWDNMNNTFSGRDLNTTYSTWWGPDQTYDNSLGAERDYFNRLITRLTSYQTTYANMTTNGSNPILINDWYAQSIKNARSEMNREGGLDWAISGAFYLNLHPTAYWAPAYIIIVLIIMVIIGGLLWLAY